MNTYGGFNYLHIQVDADVAEIIGLEMGLQVKRVDQHKDLQGFKRASELEGQTLVSRNPVVCVMRHVDHGKVTIYISYNIVLLRCFEFYKLSNISCNFQLRVM